MYLTKAPIKLRLDQMLQLLQPPLRQLTLKMEISVSYTVIIVLQPGTLEFPIEHQTQQLTWEKQ